MIPHLLPGLRGPTAERLHERGQGRHHEPRAHRLPPARAARRTRLRGVRGPAGGPLDSHVRARRNSSRKDRGAHGSGTQRARDLYDIWYLTSEGHVDLDMLVPEIDSKLEFRGRTRDGFGEELLRKEKRYKKLWTARLGAQMADIPRFDHVYRAVSRAMRAAGLMD